MRAGVQTDRACSIREFCELKMPILMFSKNGNYIALKLEEVCRGPVSLCGIDVLANTFCKLLPMSFGPEALGPLAVVSRPV